MSIFSAPLAFANYLTSGITARLLFIELIFDETKVLGAKIENDFRGGYDYDIQVPHQLKLNILHIGGHIWITLSC